MVLNQMVLDQRSIELDQQEKELYDAESELYVLDQQDLLKVCLGVHSESK